MENKNSRIKISVYILIMLIFLLFFCLYILGTVKELSSNDEYVEVEFVSQEKLETVEEIINKFGSYYIEEDMRKIYVKFSKDLFEDGISNEEYFEMMIEELCLLKKLEKETFYLIDEEKLIEIKVQYKEKLGKHVIFYNKKEDYFEVTDGEIYCKFNNIDLIKEVEISPIANELKKLIDGKMRFSKIEELLGEGEDLENGYTSYKDGSILIYKADGLVKTIIFTEKYEEEIFFDIKVGMKLDEITEKYDKGFEGSASQGYLLYRTDDIYAFLYEDEFVVYGYNYFINEKFEDYLEEYLSYGDFEKFIKFVTKRWTNYEICEINYETKTAHITYPYRGLEINIENNNPKGITLFENYYFTDKSKTLIRDGLITLKGEENSLEMFEKNRRKNSN